MNIVFKPGRTHDAIALTGEPIVDRRIDGRQRVLLHFPVRECQAEPGIESIRYFQAFGKYQTSLQFADH